MSAALLALQLVLTLPDCVPPCALAQGEEPLSLGVGTQQVLTIDWSATAWSGAIEVKTVSEHQLLVIGKSTGRGELRVKTATGERHFVAWVRKRDPDSCGSSEIWSQLPCGGDFDLIVDVDQLVIRGTYRSFEDFLQVMRLTAKYPGLRVPRATEIMLQRALSEVNGPLFRAGLEARVVRVAHGFELRAGPAEQQRAAEILADHRWLLDLAFRSR